MDWIAKQGHICPLTGAPLCETDLKPLEDLGREIREWILESAQKAPTSPEPTATSPSYGGNGASAEGPRRLGSTGPGPGSGPGSDPANDDLYDF